LGETGSKVKRGDSSKDDLSDFLHYVGNPSKEKKQAFPNRSSQQYQLFPHLTERLFAASGRWARLKPANVDILTTPHAWETFAFEEDKRG
jgi:hypothetical protein